MSQLTNSSFDFRLNQTSVLSFLNLELVHIFQLAVSQGAGGVNSSAIGAWLAEALITWFCENRNLESYEVAEFLETILNRELNLIVEDGSTDEVGTLLCDFFGICSTKSEAEIIDKVRSLPKCDLSRCRVDKNDGDVLDKMSSKILTRWTLMRRHPLHPDNLGSTPLIRMAGQPSFRKRKSETIFKEIKVPQSNDGCTSLKNERELKCCEQKQSKSNYFLRLEKRYFLFC